MSNERKPYEAPMVTGDFDLEAFQRAHDAVYNFFVEVALALRIDRMLDKLADIVGETEE